MLGAWLEFREADDSRRAEAFANQPTAADQVPEDQGSQQGRRRQHQLRPEGRGATEAGVPRS